MFLLLIGAALTSYGCADLADRPPLAVTYIANCGFMVECGDEKILIDALFGGREFTWCFSPPNSVVQLMSAARAPFDDVDLIAVTHAHSDHFNAELVGSHMRQNPRAVLVCTPQAAQQMQMFAGYALLEERIRPVSAQLDSTVDMTVGDVEVRILNGRHSPYYEEDEETGQTVDRHRDVQHLEYLFVVNGWTLFHCGDAELNDFERYRRFCLGIGAIDLAFLQWWDASEELSFSQRLVRDVVRPERVILMHLMRNHEPAGHPERQRTVAREVFVPTHVMQTLTFE